MNEARVYADGFERSFAEVKDLLEFLAERGRNAKWIRKPTNTLRLAPLEKEAQNLDAADASMEEILEDTEKNTQLVLKMRGESYPVRDCAIRTILSRAGVNGDGLRKLDMSGFDYGILDVVQVLHLRKRRGNYYDCPFCGETHGKLNINVEKNVFRCNRCDASGGMLKLYADLHNVTLSEANQQIREALGKGEYRTDYIKATPVQEEKATAELAPIEEIHRTYQRMLSMLTLNRKHQEDLQRRGLKPEQIEAQRYRSVPLFGMKKLVKRLAEEGYMVKGVPGFYRDTDGNWTINFKAENSGILIPIVSLDGFIQGFQIRVDHVTDTKKYIWLSSVNYDQGVSSGSPVHVIGDLAAERVYLTEGALKGTIAHYLSGATFVCVAGVNQYRNLKPVLERMKGYGMKQLLEAYDMDKKMKVACNKHDSKCAVCFERSPVICQHKAEKRRIIQNGCNKVYEICRELSLPMNRMVWDMDESGEWNGKHKGIDDYLAAIKQKEGTGAQTSALPKGEQS